jgi:hypothetical protein
MIRLTLSFPTIRRIDWHADCGIIFAEHLPGAAAMIANPKFKSAIDAAAEKARALARKAGEKSHIAREAVPETTQSGAYPPGQLVLKAGEKIENAMTV